MLGPEPQEEGPAMRTTAGTGVHEHVRTKTFPRRLHAAPSARHFVRQAADGHPAADDALLLAAELIANSLVHALDATTITITVAVSQSLIRIDVRDDGTLGVPHMRQGGPDAEDGRGFRLINQIARRWGFVREPDGSCCWVEVTTPAS
jgi:anti-sigma regulatory factor (Ser/Thr protein kinase)